MSLNANELRDELDAQMAALLGAPYTGDATTRANIKGGLLTAVANAVHAYIVGGGINGLEGARVSFAEGDFAGEDSNGDTPDTITAAGGLVG